MVVFTSPSSVLVNLLGQRFKLFHHFSACHFWWFLGTLMMIPLRRSLIVMTWTSLSKDACASDKSRRKGGSIAKTAFPGFGVAGGYACLQKVVHVISEVPEFATRQTQRFFSWQRSGEITPYLAVGISSGQKLGVLSRWSVKLVCFNSLLHH